MNWILLATISLGAAGAVLGQTVVTTGLQGPQKIILTPGGNFLVTETSTNPNAGRLSFVTRGGVRRSLIEELPSGTEVTGGGSGPTAMALRGRTLYLAIGAGDAERRGTQPGTFVWNPAGISSPIFSTVLSIQFSSDVDALTGTFRMSPQIQRQLGDGEEVTLQDGAGGSARVAVLFALPNAAPESPRLYRFSNLWGLALSPDGDILWVTDAAGDSLLRVETATGRWRRIMRFPAAQNSTPVGPPVIDAVPTSVRVWGDYLLVSQLTGFPFISGAARVLLIDPVQRTATPFINFLTSATDVLVRTRPTESRAQFFTLEFSLTQTATPPGPGRILRWDTIAPVVMSATLPALASMVLDEQTSTLFVLSLTGRIFSFEL